MQSPTTTGRVCLVCRSAHAQPKLAQNGYTVLRCADCGFLFVHPTPSADELAHFYDQSYAVPFERYANNTQRNEQRIIDLERWQPRRGRLLEVGASYGHSLAIARERGWQVAGVELSPAAARYAREQFGLEVFTGDLLDAPLEQAGFDAAVLWHVLEHTHDPVAQLERLKQVLRRGGVLGLRVPNAQSLGAYLAGRSWPWMCPPAHLWYFSPATLPRLLARLGFEVIEVATLRGDGNNPYQHLLIALGGRLNAMRRRLQQRRAAGSTGTPAPATTNPPALQHAWVGLLARAQPRTDALARWTRAAIEPLEAAGWGDELVCYARRPVE